MADGGCEVWFYHLERSSADAVLPELLERTLARGWRALVKTEAPGRLSELDAWLWSYRSDSFLPHGLETEGEAARQPVLLGASGGNLNGAQALFLLDGAEANGFEGYTRCVDLFDGRDEQALAAARRRWRSARAAGAPVSYWRQTEAGRWEKQA